MMPLYEFKCPICKNTDELISNCSDSVMFLNCDKCKCEMERQISKPLGIHFKGSGFYETDYKGKDK